MSYKREGMIGKKKGVGVLERSPIVQSLLAYLGVVDLYTLEETCRLQNSVFISIHVIWNEGSCLPLSVNYALWINYGKKPTVTVDFINIKSVLSKRKENN